MMQKPEKTVENMIKQLKSWWTTRNIRAKHAAAATTGAHYYGSGGTIHQTGHIDVEVHNGVVVAVWFRCCPLPFRQADVLEHRAQDMKRMYPLKMILTGVETKKV